MVGGWSIGKERAGGSIEWPGIYQQGLSAGTL